MLRQGWLRAATLMALVSCGALSGIAHPAQAGETQTSSLTPIAVAKASLEQIQAMAANGTGKLFTLEGDQAGAGTMDITCYLSIGNPYGGGAPAADVLIDAIVYCTDWVHAATLEIELFRNNSLVASDSATFPFTYGVYGTVGVTTCTAGTYFGIASAIVVRYDHSPPVASLLVRSRDVGVGCGAVPGVSVANPGDQFNVRGEAVSLQLSASGGTAPYAWSATGLPPGLTINSTTGRISGTIASTGAYGVTVTATGTTGGSGSTSFTWRVNPPPGGVTAANPGNQYDVLGDTVNLQMSASGGIAPYSWAATGLPSGLSINPSSGLISGRLRTVGTRTVTVTATGTSGGSGSITFYWQIRLDGCSTC